LLIIKILHYYLNIISSETYSYIKNLFWKLYIPEKSNVKYLEEEGIRMSTIKISKELKSLGYISDVKKSTTFVILFERYSTKNTFFNRHFRKVSMEILPFSNLLVFEVVIVATL
jgi:hypothetical protein